MHCASRIPVLGLLLCLSCLGGRAQALQPSEVFSGVAPAVAVVEAFDEKGERLGSYSATTVAPEQLVGICDVMETAASLRVGTASGSLAARVTHRDRERNLCLITAPGLPAAPLARRSRLPATGARVFAVSNALGLGIGISDGVVSGVRASPIGQHIQFTAAISPGSEGGALVDDEGRLVGIIDFRRRDGQNVNFAAAATWIDEIPQRAAASAARVQRFDQATGLLNKQQWAELRKLADSWSEAEPDVKDAWRFVATAARGVGDAETELRAWQRYYQLDETSSEAGVAYGQALLAHRKMHEALDHAQRLRQVHEGDASVWVFLGLAQVANGALADADRSYRQALAIDPWRLDAYRYLADLAQARGDAVTAIAIWSRLSGLFSGQLAPRLALVRAYLAAGRPASAWSVLDQVQAEPGSRSDADLALIWYLQGMTLSRLGCPEQAVAAYRKSLDFKPQGSDWDWAGIGFAHSEMRRYPEAISAWRAAVDAAPNNEEWRYQLAVNLKDGGHPEEALAITSDLVGRVPSDPKHWRQHGFVLAVLARDAEAIPAMERSLQIDSRQGKLWAALVESYQKVGRREDARRAYQQLRAVDSQWAETTYREAILPFEELPR